MTSHEKHKLFEELAEITQKMLKDDSCFNVQPPAGVCYDPELLYVECHVCGKPVLWEHGKTTELLLAAGVDLSGLDERCLIVSEGCPACSPLSREGYTLAVVRIAGLTPEEAVHMSRPGGTA